MTQLLDNIFWHCLAGPHARYAVGSDDVRRYAQGFSPIVGFAVPAQPNLDALARHCAPGEQLYCDGWSGAAPSGWQIDAEASMHKMVWQSPSMPAEDETLAAVPLGPQHSAQAVELAALTRPGPFGPRTIELGEYFGLLEVERLIAMAGERTRAGALHEISGVCTHPDFQGRGLARRLMDKLIRRQLQRNEVPFLHVMCSNESAHRLYLRMGFADYRQAVVRIISRV
ncbi:GNAT family N-acetyltransferase [Variovorax sp. J22R133]|uniref:GNAT family N-acetyltransferase n=1 Tax=Variovorax brevis TaxID=3053503 RepID=UPI0025758F1B|nr:GNAT family N-acetyltransferase [Variovorax sp. J22R133]MDM0115095.1 GNAT family N-acetyltransferase [Variovorax sp. J22R133]